ncbi:glycosyltransferase 87 family protein [Streptomyces sp. Je 1-369]|uniref:glycosyltransferase 87 family protein n=1 Tax=Streptomyces sp. Je 1-369 TaxID=2966192 RepID=UPI0022866DD1|nr:glycosyltransferase 87 family protein [Streptomyces sp. Je 1-369]WAM00236.1 glycosyltransferase 87 family protein [Streptomyces sp. Je 1-369]
MLAVSLTALAGLCVVQHVPMADTLVYRAEGAAVANGSDLYGFTVTEWELPATYPPFAAILFVPTTWLPLGALKTVFLVGNVALLALLVRLSCKLAGLPVRAPFLCAATALALWLEPVFQTVLFGQINLALACLVLWDLTRPPGAVGKGFAVGVAAGIKLTPAVFVVYLLLRGRVREAAVAFAGFAGTVLLGALVLPAASVDFWTRRIFETGRVGKVWIVDNQSLQGLVARLLHDAEPGAAWAVPAAVAAVVGLWLVRRAPDEPRALLLAAFTALLVSPISWSHHWVWCVPLSAVLIAAGRPRVAAAVAVLFAARTFWLLPHEGDLDLHLPWWQQALASPYALLALAAWPVLRVSVLGQQDVRVVEHPKDDKEQTTSRHHVLSHDL